MSRPQKLFAWVKDTHTGKVMKVYIKPSSDTSKLERNIVYNVEKGLYLSKSFDYQNKKDQENAGG